MKKYISVTTIYALILSQMFIVAPSNATNVNVLSSVVWEVRPWATVGNVNGCGFAYSDNSGNKFTGSTDYTQQDSAQLTITDLATASGTDVRLISVTGGFTSAMVGNYIHITAGTNFNPDWYLITSVDSGTSVSVAWPANTATVGSAGTGRIGGACSLNSTTDDQFFDNIWSSNTVWIASGTTNLGQTVTVAAPWKTILSTPAIINGYGNGGRGDGALPFQPLGSATGYALINTGANTFTLGHSFYLNNIAIYGTGTTLYAPNQYCFLNKCKIINPSISVDRIGFSSGIRNIIRNSEFIVSRGVGMNITLADISVANSYFHDSKNGISLQATRQRILNSIFSNNSNAGIDVPATGDIMYPVDNCTFNGYKSVYVSTGIGMFSTTTYIVSNSLFSNLYKGMGQRTNFWGMQNSIFANNAFYNCKSTVTDAINLDSTNLMITTDPYTNINEIYATTAACTAATNEIKMEGGGFFLNAGVTDGLDSVYYVGGNVSDIAFGNYMITAHSSFSITTAGQACSNTGQNHVIVIPTGRNYAINTNLKAKGNPATFSGSSTTAYMDIGAVQRQESTSTGFIIQ